MSRTLKGLATVAAPLLAVGGSSTALAATTTRHGSEATLAAKPAVDAAHYVTWQNQYSARYLHVKGGSKANSAAINVYTGSGSCADHGVKDLQCEEEWQQISTGYASEFAYKNVNSGKCMDDGEDHAPNPTQYSCGTYPVQMRWRYGVASPGGAEVDTLGVETNYTDDPTYYLCELKGTTYDLYVVSYYSAEGEFNNNFDFEACSWQ